jgi:hypothetical protein
MDRDDIDRLWQQALHESIAKGEAYTRYRFAELVAEHEREACAKFVEEVYVRQFQRPWREDLAAAIRARGQA